MAKGATASTPQVVGGNFQTLHQFRNTVVNEHFGGPLASAGDVDADGFDDLIVGAPHSDPNGVLDAGSAFVYSGATGAVLYEWTGTSIGMRF